MRAAFIFLFMLITFSQVYGQELNKDNIYFKIYEAAQKAQDNDVEGIRTLYKMSLEDHKDPMLTKMLIKSTVLGMIKTNSKAIVNYIPSVDSKFISLDPMGFLGQSPFQIQCFKCQGKGIIESLCKDCRKGVCKNCKGTKQISYKGLGGQFIIKNCITCKATGKCINCGATGTAKKECHICVEKGTIFSGRVVPEEYDKTLNYMINFLPKYAAGKNVLITGKMVEIAKRNELNKELEEAKRLAEEKQAEELAAIEADRKAQEAKRAEKEKREKETFVERPKTSSRDEDLKHVLLEFNQFFRNRERISKQSIYENADARFVKGRPTLIIAVTASVGRVNESLKMQYLEAFYSFWKLRCVSNGLGGDVGYSATFQEKEIAQVEGGAVVLSQN